MRGVFLSGLVVCLAVGAGCGRIPPPAARVVAKAASLAVGEAEAAGAALRTEPMAAHTIGNGIASQSAKSISSNAQNAGRSAGGSGTSRGTQIKKQAPDLADLAWDLTSGSDPTPTRTVPSPPPPLPVWPGTWGGLEYPVIIDVDPFGPAGRAGVRPGDILLSYNGVDLSDETSTNDVLDAAIDAAAARRQVTAVILIGRNGQLLQGVVPAGVRMGIRYRTSR